MNMLQAHKHTKHFSGCDGNCIQYYLGRLVSLFIIFVCLYFLCVFAVDINECVNNPCKNDGRCIDGSNGVTCECVGDYKGATCTGKGGMHNIFGVLGD